MSCKRIVSPTCQVWMCKPNKGGIINFGQKKQRKKVRKLLAARRDAEGGKA